MEETLPHFALGKSANLLAIAASLRERGAGVLEAQALRRPQGDGYRRLFGTRSCLKPFDISQAPALAFDP